MPDIRIKLADDGNVATSKGEIKKEEPKMDFVYPRTDEKVEEQKSSETSTEEKKDETSQEAKTEKEIKEDTTPEWAKKRFREYSQKVKNRDKEITLLKSEVAELRKAITPEPNPEPNPDDYDYGEDDIGYIKSHNRWLKNYVDKKFANIGNVEQIKKEPISEDEEEFVDEKIEIDKDDVEDLIKRGRLKFGDDFKKYAYDDPNIPYNNNMREIIFNSPNGEEIAYYLAKNPWIANEIANLSINSMEIAKELINKIDLSEIEKFKKKNKTNAPTIISSIEPTMLGELSKSEKDKLLERERHLYPERHRAK